MEFLTTNVESNVATVTMNRPPANALASELLKELSSLLDKLEVDQEVRVVLLKGEGRFFSAGADIKEFTTIDSSEGFSNYAKYGQDLFNRIESFPKPIIAAIHGAALGGGLELAMSCHIRLASEKAKLGLPELQLGIIPGFAGTQRLPRLVGIPKAAEMMLTSEPVTGQEAATIGLVNKVFPEEVLFSEAAKLAEKIATKSPLSLKATIELLQYSKGGTYEQGVNKERELFGELFMSADAKEGVSAFLEKRPPSFKGK